ncbi:MAG TPA: glycine cleavage T C-terminal barrel domain-containing protein, partial [Pyrinomonadaceae bacterium]|nr:glycine cleavage T C-terminal barrel domain-containing protein [Pyrinomonadaceae bacterium]
ARIHWRGHVAKRLAGLSLDEGDAGPLIPPEAKVKTEDGREIGRITSATYSPRLHRTIALGYLKYDYLKPGTPVRVSCGDEEHAAHVVELPFVRGSWEPAPSATEAKE